MVNKTYYVRAINRYEMVFFRQVEIATLWTTRWLEVFTIDIQTDVTW